MNNLVTKDFPADFRHVRNWVFDLDNTLYAAESGVLTQIEARMGLFIADHFKIDKEAAHGIRQKLYREHGTTLSGLMALHGVDPERFLDFVHDIKLDMLAHDAELVSALTRLPGRRFVFTNSCYRHAGRILEKVGIAHLFDAVWDIRTIGFVPKPDPAAYARVIAQARIAPEEAAMFDDLPANLAAAHALGMTTVWLDSASRWPKTGPASKVPQQNHIDHAITDLARFLNAIRI
ncbi:MAG TPA: pyrimidine 5'-nucleotidase [Rhizomicrobium sp.]